MKRQKAFLVRKRSGRLEWLRAAKLSRSVYRALRGPHAAMAEPDLVLEQYSSAVTTAVLRALGPKLRAVTVPSAADSMVEAVAEALVDSGLRSGQQNGSGPGSSGGERSDSDGAAGDRAVFERAVSDRAVSDWEGRAGIGTFEPSDSLDEAAAAPSTEARATPDDGEAISSESLARAVEHALTCIGRPDAAERFATVRRGRLLRRAAGGDGRLSSPANGRDGLRGTGVEGRSRPSADSGSPDPNASRLDARSASFDDLATSPLARMPDQNPPDQNPEVDTASRGPHHRRNDPKGPSSEDGSSTDEGPRGDSACD